MSLVTLMTFNNIMDAHILMARLESDGIECFLFDGNIVTVNPLYNIAVGGIKLKIYEEDLEYAQEILAEINETPYTDEQEAPITCPDCNSTKVHSGFKSMKGVRGVISMIVAFTISVIPIYHKIKYRCKECDTEFDVYKN